MLQIARGFSFENIPGGGPTFPKLKILPTPSKLLDPPMTWTYCYRDSCVLIPMNILKMVSNFTFGVEVRGWGVGVSAASVN